jgi:hypothetical protein
VGAPPHALANPSQVHIHLGGLSLRRHKMKRLSEEELNKLAKTIEESSYGGLEKFESIAYFYEVKAYIEFPLGEILNPGISGYVPYWYFSGRLKVAPIKGRGEERFDAQGLEGKAVVKTDLVTAIIVWRELPKYRCNVLVDNHF